STAVSNVPAAPIQTVTVDFTEIEQKAFEDLSEFLRPNPRHIKRIINVYRLVRSLVESKERTTIGYQSRALLDREATMRWLVICGQWPYTAYMMLEIFKQLLKDNSDSVEALVQKHDASQNDPLMYLYTEALKSPKFSKEMQRKLDFTPERLVELLTF